MYSRLLSRVALIGNEFEERSKWGQKLSRVKGWCKKFPECMCGLETVCRRMIWPVGAQRAAKGKFWGLIFSCSEEQKSVPSCKSRITPRKVSAYSHSYFQDLCELIGSREASGLGTGVLLCFKKWCPTKPGAVLHRQESPGARYS